MREGKSMQVLFRRSLRTGGIYTNRPRFVLWVKFDVDVDERRLIRKYNAGEAYINPNYG